MAHPQPQQLRQLQWLRQPGHRALLPRLSAHRPNHRPDLPTLRRGPTTGRSTRPRPRQRAPPGLPGLAHHRGLAPRRTGVPRLPTPALTAPPHPGCTVDGPAVPSAPLAEAIGVLFTARHQLTPGSAALVGRPSSVSRRPTARPRHDETLPSRLPSLCALCLGWVMWGSRSKPSTTETTSKDCECDDRNQSQRHKHCTDHSGSGDSQSGA